MGRRKERRGRGGRESKRECQIIMKSSEILKKNK